MSTPTKLADDLDRLMRRGKGNSPTPTGPSGLEFVATAYCSGKRLVGVLIPDNGGPMLTPAEARDALFAALTPQPGEANSTAEEQARAIQFGHELDAEEAQPGEAAALAGELGRLATIFQRDQLAGDDLAILVSNNLSTILAALARQEPDAGAVERVASELTRQMEELPENRDEHFPSSLARDRGLVWLEGWFDLRAALVPADPKGET